MKSTSRTTGIALSALFLAALPFDRTDAFVLDNGDQGVHGVSARLSWEWGKALHWDLRELPKCRVPFSACFAAGAETLLTVEAFQEWENVSPSLIRFLHVPCDSLSRQYGKDNWNIVYGETDKAKYAASGAPAGEPADENDEIIVGEAAITCIWSDSTGRILEVDIVLNNTPDRNFNWVIRGDGVAVNWAQTVGSRVPQPGTPYEADMRTVITHEIGHLIGLNHTVTEGAIMNTPEVALNGLARHFLGDDDEDGCGFLYTQDLGDAPDPWMGTTPGNYPTVIRDKEKGRTLNGVKLDAILKGAAHFFGLSPLQSRNFMYEWLGSATGSSNISEECDPWMVDIDAYDDGVEFVPDPPVWGRKVSVKTTLFWANDNKGFGHDYFAVGPMWVFGWFDENRDCIWVDGERFLIDSHAPPMLQGNNAKASKSFTRELDLPAPDGYKDYWLRARLDWNEAAGLVQSVLVGLNQTEGAALFGEVEDYQLWCWGYCGTQWPNNTTGEFLDGVAVVFAGDASHDNAFAADVDQNDCIVGVLPPEFIQANYDSMTDETLFEFFGNVPPLRNRRSTVFQEDSPTKLRSYWIPQGGVPTIDHEIPTTHASFCPSWTDSVLYFSIGALNDAVGGPILGSRDSLEVWTWDDSIFVDVSYRVSPTEIPCDRLSPCDSLVTSLASHPVGTAWITPERPFTWQLLVPADLQVGDALLLEVQSSWSKNGNTNHEMMQFRSVDPATDVTGDGHTPTLLQVATLMNPFSTTTTIRYSLPTAGPVTLEVFDVRGRRVRQLFSSDHRPRGTHLAFWNGTDDTGRQLASGVYFYRIRTANEEAVRRVVLLR